MSALLCSSTGGAQRRDPLAFRDAKKLIGLEVFKSFHQAAGPADFQALDPGGITQSEMEPHVVMRQVTPPAPHLGHLHPIADFYCDTRPDCIAIAFGAH